LDGVTWTSGTTDKILKIKPSVAYKLGRIGKGYEDAITELQKNGISIEGTKYSSTRFQENILGIGLIRFIE
jgi:hypothetical protein